MTRFGEILPLWQKIESLCISGGSIWCLAKFWTYFGNFYVIWQIFNVVNVQILNNENSQLVALAYVAHLFPGIDRSNPEKLVWNLGSNLHDLAQTLFPQKESETKFWIHNIFETYTTMELFSRGDEQLGGFSQNFLNCFLKQFLTNKI